MLFEADNLVRVLEKACRKAQKIYETSGKQSYYAGRYEGLKEALCLVEGLVSGEMHCPDDL